MLLKKSFYCTLWFYNFYPLKSELSVNLWVANKETRKRGLCHFLYLEDVGWTEYSYSRLCDEPIAGKALHLLAAPCFVSPWDNRTEQPSSLATPEREATKLPDQLLMPQLGRVDFPRAWFRQPGPGLSTEQRRDSGEAVPHCRRVRNGEKGEVCKGKRPALVENTASQIGKWGWCFIFNL